jgi:predicted GNAT family acetyltransferase
MATEPADIVHAPAHRRFELTVGDALAVLDYTEIDSTTLDFTHTFVPHALRGRGIASRLVRFGLEYALDHHLKVVPSCPFVATYLESHPRYRAVLGE